ncbi:MAG: hypothetical protein ABR497_09160 [Kiritimatiellia bacterium]
MLIYKDETALLGNPLGETALDCRIIEDHLLLVFTVFFDDNKFNISRGLSFMKDLNVPWCIAVNFDKKNVQLNGLSIRGSALPSVAHHSHIRGSALPSVAHHNKVNKEHNERTGEKLIANGGA